MRRGTGLLVDRQSGRLRIATRTNRYVYFYRAVVEAHLGRDLRSDEHVHHINGDRTDDRIENLAILSPAEHTRLHLPYLQDARRDKRAFRWSRDFPRCQECGTNERPYCSKGYCQRCYHRLYMRQRRASGVAA